ncbi:MAG: serine--tRNA ligase [Chitinispirillales bacterium]|jgi:seryl-tRNA synthetase|nr:serine--tRNA ligase [Chitinispirillales bacterium]
MLDIKFICENIQKVKDICKIKKDNADIDKIVELDVERKKILAEVEELKHKRNDASIEIAAKKKKNEDASQIISQMQNVSAKIKELDDKVDAVIKERDEIMAKVPNISHESVPHGESEKDNVVCKEWGEKPAFNFEPKDHLTIAENLKIFDFARGAKISGSGFPVLRGNGAKLNRALINFFLDTHRKNGYTEVQPPYLVNAKSAFGTGQLPKSKEQMYYVGEDDLYAIPTAEVPITNLYRDEYIDENNLPVKMCAYSACFRREAGAYGKDTKGFLRVHQFDKVELVKISHPDNSYEELERLRSDAEIILQKLKLPYRVLTLCDADLSFAAAKCYDLEVWAGGEKKWLEVSSVSNFEAFQATRINIRFRRGGSKPEFVHTLNGSGVATARILVAILENYQTEKGGVIVPEVLRPYMDGLVEIANC